MAFMKRLSGVVQAKANKVLDRVEDPRETLDLSYEKQLEQLQQVRKGVADVATARKRLELQAQQLQTSANKLQDQAKQAISQNREDLAREALGRRAAIGEQLEGLRVQHEQLAAQEQKLIATTQQLHARVESFRSQKETLKASYTAAEAQTKIGEAVSGISESISDTGMAMQRAQDKISSMQARAGAMDELLSSGALTDLSGSSDPIQAELDKTSRAGQVDLELAQLKGELAAPEAPALAAPATGAAAADDEVAEGEPAPSAEGSDMFTLEGGKRLVIVRILDDAQYEIPPAAEERLTQLDAVVDRALAAHDEDAFHRALAELAAERCTPSGTPVDAATILPSDLVLPHDGASLSEVHDLLASEADS